ncbi:hypothetical protein K9B33_17855 [Sphingobium sp. 3R8]|uniref:hypothetical protein n=1 Tax=Sphingobium sp. 3R8 TaxID=2874921 RepID=UPI001CC97E26|nr:hypothetical protein [Sphingobium sp. 3R8]MBZ9649403.1 hypothetical protein [Sphingobium sp. 3R8]
MALNPDIQAIFGDSPARALTWAKAIIASQGAAMETEHKMAVDHGDSGEFSAMSWSVHAEALDAAHALIKVAEFIEKAARR